MAKMFKPKNAVEWYYAHDADLTIGEVKVSKTAKIILIIVLSVLVIATAAGVYFRNTIYDYFANPDIMLTQEQVVIPVNSEFDPTSYVLNDDDTHILEIIYPEPSDVDTAKVGEYIVTYTARNSVHENTHELTVKVVDDTPPVIELTTNLLILVRGEETEKFDAAAYIKDYYDNYDDKDTLVVSYEKNINWNKDVLELNYSVKDSAGLEGFAVLNIVINDAPEPHTHAWDNGKVLKAATETEEGIKEYTCTGCGETYKETLSKLPASTEDPTNPSGTEEPTKPPAHKHTWNGGEVIKAATTESTGTRRYTCTGCGQTYDETIAKLPKPPQPVGPSLSADSFTWSFSKDGDVSALLAAAASRVHYVGSGNAFMKSQAQFVVGTNTIVWSCTEGLTCEQRITCTE